MLGVCAGTGIQLYGQLVQATITVAIDDVNTSTDIQASPFASDASVASSPMQLLAEITGVDETAHTVTITTHISQSSGASQGSVIFQGAVVEATTNVSKCVESLPMFFSPTGYDVLM